MVQLTLGAVSPNISLLKERGVGRALWDSVTTHLEIRCGQCMLQPRQRRLVQICQALLQYLERSTIPKVSFPSASWLIWLYSS